jgi:hypothetical protein
LECSPKVLRHGWGELEIDGIGTRRDAKLWPGGGREWDWGARGIDVILEETSLAIRMYNDLVAQGTRVATLIHSTC